MRIALTGGIGAGKSTVSALLVDRGAVVIDADSIAREIVEPGTPALAEIKEAFGPDVIQPDGRLDRPLLASIVFADDASRRRLNEITHPRIAARSAQIIAGIPADAVAVYDMPLLVEQGPEALAGWDAVVVVDAPDDLRVRRLVDRGLAAEDAWSRVAAQATREERLAAATFVIDNAGDVTALEAQVDGLWRELTDDRA